MDFAVFVDPEVHEHDVAIEIAAALSEFCVIENRTLALLCDAATALEIGLDALGLQESRTVEGGKRRSSPVSLLPFIPRPDFPDVELLWRDGKDTSGGGIEDIYNLGIFAGDDESDVRSRFRGEPFSAFERLVAETSPEFVVGLGTRSNLWKAVASGIDTGKSRRTRVVLIDDLSSPNLVPGMEHLRIVRRELGSVDGGEKRFAEIADDFRNIERQAWRDGELVGSFLAFLSSIAKERLLGPG